jgi:hypothetical protein
MPRISTPCSPALAMTWSHDINQGGREIGKEKFRWFNAMMSKSL